MSTITDVVYIFQNQGNFRVFSIKMVVLGILAFLVTLRSLKILEEIIESFYPSHLLASIIKQIKAL